MFDQVENLNLYQSMQMLDHWVETMFADELNVIPNENNRYVQLIVEYVCSNDKEISNSIQIKEY